jgi:hypothetical protein
MGLLQVLEMLAAGRSRPYPGGIAIATLPARWIRSFHGTLLKKSKTNGLSEVRGFHSRESGSAKRTEFGQEVRLLFSG